MSTKYTVTINNNNYPFIQAGSGTISSTVVDNCADTSFNFNSTFANTPSVVISFYPPTTAKYTVMPTYSIRSINTSSCEFYSATKDCDYGGTKSDPVPPGTTFYWIAIDYTVS